MPLPPTPNVNATITIQVELDAAYLAAVGVGLTDAMQLLVQQIDDILKHEDNGSTIWDHAITFRIHPRT